LLRGVAVLRERPLDRLGGELVAEAAQVKELVVGHLGCLLGYTSSLLTIMPCERS
jgi:hypothetical protein